MLQPFGPVGDLLVIEDEAGFPDVVGHACALEAGNVVEHQRRHLDIGM